MASKRAPRLSNDDRRVQILDSAKALILERGLSNCTLEEVAIYAGISKALIYRHFSKLEELLEARPNHGLAAVKFIVEGAETAVVEHTPAWLDAVSAHLERTGTHP